MITAYNVPSPPWPPPDGWTVYAPRWCWELRNARPIGRGDYWTRRGNVWYASPAPPKQESNMPRPNRMSTEEKIAAACLAGLLLLSAIAMWFLTGCQATARGAGATALEGLGVTLDTGADAKAALAALQRAQTASVCVSTEVRAARATLAADVAPILPGPAAEIDLHLDRVERCAADLPPALAAAAKAAPTPAATDMGDRRVWRWGARLGAITVLCGMAALALALVWGLGTPRLGAGIAAAGAALAVTSYVWQTWAHVATIAAGLLALAALMYAAWINREALKAALRMDAAIKSGYAREDAKAVAVAEQSPAVAAAIARAKRVLPVLPPLPPATPTPPAKG